VHRLRNSKQLGDHAHRHWGQASSLTRSACVASLKESQDSFSDFLDFGPKRFRSCRAEAFVHQLPDPGRFPRIGENHPQTQQANEFFKLTLPVQGQREQHPAGTLDGKSRVFCNCRNSAWLTTAQTSHPPAHIHQMQWPLLEPAMIGGIGSWTNSFAPQLDEIRAG